MASTCLVSPFFALVILVVSSEALGLFNLASVLSTSTKGNKGFLSSILNTVEGILSFLPREPEDAESRPYEASFCYDNGKSCGQQNWDGMCKKGKLQSPINIRTSQVKLVEASKNPLKFDSNYFQTHRGYYVANNGHSVVVQLRKKGRSDLGLYVSDLNVTFYFSHIHFHWNSLDDHKGSEHRLDGHGYEMEIHMVHYNSKFPSIEEALKSGEPNLAAVIAMFVNVGEHNRNLASIVKAIEKYALEDTHGHRGVNKSMNVYNILPKTDRFFRYQGSLTVPKCVENLLWIVFEDPIQISKEQMKTFHRVNCHSCPNHKMKNVRRVMPRNERTIEYFNLETGMRPELKKEEILPEDEAS